MREWTREEKYRYLKDPQELKELYDRISKSGYRQTFHNQAVTGLMNDPNGSCGMTTAGTYSISGARGALCTDSNTGTTSFRRTW